MYEVGRRRGGRAGSDGCGGVHPSDFREWRSWKNGMRATPAPPPHPPKSPPPRPRDAPYCLRRAISRCWRKHRRLVERRRMKSSEGDGQTAADTSVSWGENGFRRRRLGPSGTVAWWTDETGSDQMSGRAERVRRSAATPLTFRFPNHRLVRPEPPSSLGGLPRVLCRALSRPSAAPIFKGWAVCLKGPGKSPREPLERAQAPS